MKYDPKIHHRRSIRLQGYDYSQAGAYFVTICTQHRESLFGEIAGGEMQLNDMGWIVIDEWIKTAEIRNQIELDEWVAMPNHFHEIAVMADGRVTGRRDPTVERFGQPDPARFPRLSGHSNPLLPNASTN